jgi:hypothetical protein
MKSKGELLASILNKFKDYCFFLHNTKEFSIVEKIISEGFIFESQLSRSTDRVNPKDPVEVTYFLFQRKDYGSFTVVIAISKATYDLYSLVSNKNNIGLEEVLSISDPYFGDNDELIYTLSPKHILGYFDNSASEFTRNPNWDPDYVNHKLFSADRVPEKSIRKK